MIITGNPVPNAKLTGSKYPMGDSTAIGIIIPKYTTPLSGQNAKAKIIPSTTGATCLPPKGNRGTCS